MSVRALGLASLLALTFACGDDDATPMSPADGGMDAHTSLSDAGPAPMCGTHTCGSPLVGAHCCTGPDDVARGLAGAADRCGTDLTPIVATLAGTCVELRRPGTVDDQCPPHAVGALLELGCCMPDGMCGTLNTAADLGCQRVLGGDAAPVACGVVGADGGQPDAR